MKQLKVKCDICGNELTSKLSSETSFKDINNMNVFRFQGYSVEDVFGGNDFVIDEFDICDACSSKLKQKLIQINFEKLI